MTQAERSKIGEYWFGLAQMYGKELPRMSIKIMLDAVDDISAEEVFTALEQWSKSAKQNRHPLPGEIRTLVKKELSNDMKAIEAANRIRSAIAKIGWANPKEAREYIGELGWAVIERTGGWLYVCENHGVELNPLTFHAQARDSAKSILEQGALGIFNQPVQLTTEKVEKPRIGLQKFDSTKLIGSTNGEN